MLVYIGSIIVPQFYLETEVSRQPELLPRRQARPRRPISGPERKEL